ISHSRPQRKQRFPYSLVLRDRRGGFCYNLFREPPPQSTFRGHLIKTRGSVGAMLDIGEVFSNLLGLFLLIGVGYGAVRFRVLPASASKLFSQLLMNVTLPATVLTSLVQPYDPAFLSSGLLEVALG